MRMQPRPAVAVGMEESFNLAVVALKVSVLVLVLAIGLGTTWSEATYLFRRPRLLANSILARNVAVPVVAVLLIAASRFQVAVAIALGVLAVTPVPPLLPKSQLQAGCRSNYVLSLLVSQSLLAVVLVPVTIALMNLALGTGVHFSTGRVAALVSETVLVPLAAGMGAAALRPRLRRIAPGVSVVGLVLLAAGFLPLLVLGWNAFHTLAGNGALLAIAVFVIAGLAAGHFLGGPRPEDRTALALGASSRHPGLAFAIARANFPEQARAVAGAIVIYLILRVLLSTPYLLRMRHRRRSPGLGALDGARQPHA